MIRFAIVTPTIGRDTLRRCLIMMDHQVLKDGYDYVQFVVGDGPQEPWVTEECGRHSRVRYMESVAKEGFYGTAPRNQALAMIESGLFGNFDYIMFLDDDNLLLEPALYNLAAAITCLDSQPLIFQDILFTNKYRTQYEVIPKGGMPLIEGDWDSLNGVYRADVIRGLRWEAVYRHDWLFAKEADKKAGSPIWVKCPGINAVHCLSWDTYEQVRKS